MIKRSPLVPDLLDSEIGEPEDALVPDAVRGGELVAGGFEADPETFFFAQPAVEPASTMCSVRLRMNSTSRVRRTLNSR
ncbi:hypothetical protein [Streptomyces sp. NPDC020362]|uniref:hypothetical protein n=1 Tax=Streptomyces sp. NPDC020362 TaxID=3154486 RepID=UPI0033F21FF3